MLKDLKKLCQQHLKQKEFTSLKIETMFSRFQILVSGLQVLDKSYTEADHVRKIL
jgi:hypothetical protein